MSSIALARASISTLEQQWVCRALRSGRLALGPFAARFEEMVADYVGVRNAVAVSSGTAGLHLVVRALELGPGDEVITTPFSFIASANCLLYEGVRPVFCDIDPDTLCLDPARIEARITERTRAILAVDVFGHPADWPALTGIAERHNLLLIEDACEALGAGIFPESRGRTRITRCGSFGDAAVFAFYPNKQLTTGEGGIVVTDNRRLAELCRSMANQGRRLDTGPAGCCAWLEHVRLGYNYRLDELSAALGCAQMYRFNAILSKRQAVAAAYSRLLKGVPEIRLPYCSPQAAVSWFVYCIRLAPQFTRRSRDRILARLRDRRIECSDYFRPIHLQPFYQRRFGFRRGDFPNAEAAGDRTIALPFHARLRRREIERVVTALKDALAAESAAPASRRRTS